MTTYTVLDPDGAFMDGGLTAEQAAHMILEYNGREWEIRILPAAAEYRLYCSERSRNSGGGAGKMQPSLHCHSDEKAPAEAYAEIFNKVILHSCGWARTPYALPDEAYRELCAAGEEGE